jgi:hypothetical protein
MRAPESNKASTRFRNQQRSIYAMSERHTIQCARCPDSVASSSSRRWCEARPSRKAGEGCPRAQAQADAIGAGVFDLKVVNPNAVVRMDTRTPEQIIASIEQQGTIIADSLRSLLYVAPLGGVTIAGGPRDVRLVRMQNGKLLRTAASREWPGTESNRRHTDFQDVRHRRGGGNRPRLGRLSAVFT